MPGKSLGVTSLVKGLVMKASPESYEEQARVFQSLGDKTRLCIVSLLAKGEVCVTDLCSTLQLPQSSVSHHLGLLRIAGLVKTRRDGKKIFYRQADVTKHRLGKKAKGTRANRAAFGPAELTLL